MRMSKEVRAMTCRRCNGFMVSDQIFDLRVSPDGWLHVWRCVNCGAVVEQEKRAASGQATQNQPS